MRRHATSPDLVDVHDLTEANAASPAAARSVKILFWIVAAFACLVPLWISPASKDVFRYPKELLVRIEAFAILIACAWLYRPSDLFRREHLRDRVVQLTLAVIAWYTLTTLVSTNLERSLSTLGWVIACSVIFLATYATVPAFRFAALAIPLVPAVINALLVGVQELGLYNPIYPEAKSAVDPHQYTTGLLGNPNDAGTFLVLPALAAATLALTFKSRRIRTGSLAAVAILTAGIFFSSTVTAIGALMVGYAVMGLTALKLTRKRLILAGALLAIVAIALAATPAAQYRWQAARDAVRNGDYDRLLTGRAGSFAAAWEMFTRRPLTGTGPGTFGWNYMEYRQQVQEEHPRLLLSQNRRVNFGEVHNDHLEVLAETGVVGFALLLAAFLVAGARKRRSSDSDRFTDDSLRRFSAKGGLAISASMFVLMLAQFPLQLAATTLLILHYGAILARGNAK